MPNWCANKIEVTGPESALQVFLAKCAPVVNDDQATERVLKMLLAGMAGYLQPVRTIEGKLKLSGPYGEFTWLPAENSGRVCEPNEAYTVLLELLADDAYLTHNVIQQVDDLYRKSGVANILFTGIDRNRRRLLKKVMKAVHFDHRGFLGRMNVERFWISMGVVTRAVDSERPFSFTQFAPEKLLVAVNGFNGRLFDGISDGYHGNCDRFGTKWDACDAVIEQMDDRVTIDFDTAWSPPEPVVTKMAMGQPELMIEYFFAEQGMNYCGYRAYEHGQCFDSSDDSLEMSFVDEDGCCDVIGPDYVVNNLSNYGG